MPVYEYACSACGHRTDIIHGINEPGPRFCPECGAEDTMRKAFVVPAIVFKGSGWAKKDRSSTVRAAAAKDDKAADGASDARSDAKADAKTDTTATSADTKATGSTTSSSSKDSSSSSAAKD